MVTDPQTLIGTFPALADDPAFAVTSPETWDYNCIAWAHQEIRWEWGTIDYPDDPPYWPASVPRGEMISHFIANFQASGFSVCDSESLDENFLKIALFTDPDGVVTHAARQLSDGTWTSKIGGMSDIRHSLHSLEGEIYGKVHCIMRRQIPSDNT